MPELRYLTAGESHGRMLTGILEGVPAGLELAASRDIDPILKQRQSGYGRGRRQKIEQDAAEITSGVRFGVTTGGPIGLLINNKDWENWRERMHVEPGAGHARRVTVPRPGHADYGGAIKYAHEQDIRNVLERASARETAMRTAVGAISIRLLAAVDISVTAYVRAIGTVVCDGEVAEVSDMGEEDDLRLIDPTRRREIEEEIDRAREAGDTLGGVVEVIVTGMPVGVGSHVQWDRKLDASLAAAAMSVQAVKGVEIGDGFESAQARGSQVHDAFSIEGSAVTRTSNSAGGIEGGMSNGMPIRVRAAMKPISTLMDPLDSFDFETGMGARAHIERSDVCAVPALSVILRSVVAFTIAREVLRDFGGDTLRELEERIAARRARPFTTQA